MRIDMQKEAKGPPFEVAKAAAKEDPGDGISRQTLGYGPDAMIGKVCLKAGVLIAMFSRPCEDFLSEGE